MYDTKKKEKCMTHLVARAMKEKKDGGGRLTLLLRHAVEISTRYLHEDDVVERGGLISSPNAGQGKDYVGRDPVGIVEY